MKLSEVFASEWKSRKAPIGFGARAATVAAAAGADVTPNPTPNWLTVVADWNVGLWTYREQQITGIDAPITLSITLSAPISGMTLYYRVNSSSGTFNSSTAPSLNGMTSIVSGGTFVVTNNQYVSFGADSNGAAGGIVTATINNVTNGNAVLDTFQVQVVI